MLGTSNPEAMEFAKAEEYARLSKELVTFRKNARYADYEAKLLEIEAARKRCERARLALKQLRITGRNLKVDRCQPVGRIFS
jgi:hypothetical protein